MPGAVRCASMDKKVVLVFGCAGLIWHLDYLDMHHAAQTITKPRVTSAGAYTWPTPQDMGSSLTTSAVYVLG
jgi:hypothetical protein